MNLQEFYYHLISRPVCNSLQHSRPICNSLQHSLGEVFMVELCRHHFRVWNLGGYHFTLIYFRLATN